MPEIHGFLYILWNQATTMRKSPFSKSLVLYADDDPDDIALMQEAFTPFSATVELKTFADGLSLLQYLEKNDVFQPVPSLVVLDINMPRLSGKEVLERLRGQHRFDDLCVVLFSTSTLPCEIEFAKKHNAGFVSKPLLSSQIDYVVERLFSHCSEEVRSRIIRG